MGVMFSLGGGLVGCLFVVVSYLVVAVVAHGYGRLAILLIFSAVSFYLWLLSSFAIKNCVPVKKVGLVYEVSYLFYVIKSFALRIQTCGFDIGLS